MSKLGCLVETLRLKTFWISFRVLQCVRAKDAGFRFP